MDSDLDEDTKMESMSNHVVAFIDILGQKDLLRQMTFIPTCEEEWEKILPLMQQTKGAVDAFRHGFDSLLQDFKNYTLPARKFENPNQQKIYDSIGACGLSMHSFSDFILIHSSVGDTKTNYPIIDIWHMLILCAHMFVTMLRVGKPIRGGIALGPAFDGELYGNPYCVAYDLESSCAKWPRIVVHEELARYIWCQDGQNETDPRRPINVGFQDMCRNLLAVDVDGQIIVDYMGSAYRETLAVNPAGHKDFCKHLHMAFEFALSEQKRFRGEKNHKLALYYHMLARYMAVHINDWPKDEEEKI